VSDGCDRVWQKLENQSTDDCVEWVGIAEGRNVGTMKGRIVEPDRQGTFAGRVNRCLI
jgi:hypothetical protein